LERGLDSSSFGSDSSDLWLEKSCFGFKRLVLG